MDVIYFVLLFFYAQFVGRLQKNKAMLKKRVKQKNAVVKIQFLI